MTDNERDAQIRSLMTQICCSKNCCYNKNGQMPISCGRTEMETCGIVIEATLKFRNTHPHKTIILRRKNESIKR